ncbi:MAG: ABC transporter ATP-binding protein [Fusobacteriaceae bacterium]
MIKLKNISKQFGDLKVLENISLEFPKNKISVILGESGCGKTTILNLISKVLKDFSGELKSEHNEISYIFQEERLVPWITIFENIELILKNSYSEEKRKEIIEEILKRLKILDFKNCYPNELSGGMKKKVEIAKSLLYPSTLILMDEPFSSLDINNRELISKDFLKIQKNYPKTVVLVTHDIDTAVALGDCIFIFTPKPTKLKKVLIREDFKDPVSLKKTILSLLYNV